MTRRHVFGACAGQHSPVLCAVLCQQAVARLSLEKAPAGAAQNCGCAQGQQATVGQSDTFGALTALGDAGLLRPGPCTGLPQQLGGGDAFESCVWRRLRAPSLCRGASRGP